MPLLQPILSPIGKKPYRPTRVSKQTYFMPRYIQICPAQNTFYCITQWGKIRILGQTYENAGKIWLTGQNGPKMEPRGAKNRSRSRKMAEDSARQRQGAAQEAQTGLWRKAGTSKWDPKSTKIGEKFDEKIDHFLKSHFVSMFFRILLHFGANLGPTWHQLGVQNPSKKLSKSTSKLDWF